MLVVETIARIRREHFVQGKSIKEIARDLRLSRNTVRKVLRSDETSFAYERQVQPRPKLGRWKEELDRLLAANAEAPARERLTLIRDFEELRALGYEGGYDAVRRYARTWSKQHAGETAQAYVPLTFAPGEAYQFDSHGGPRVKSFCWSRVRFRRTAVSMGTSGFDPSGRSFDMSPFGVGGEKGERETWVEDAQHRRSRHARSVCP
jgi:transposase-like protein